MLFTSISLADFYNDLHHKSVIDIDGTLCRARGNFSQLCTLFARWSIVAILALRQDRIFSTRKCRWFRQYSERSECLKPLLRKVVKRRGPEGWNYFRWTRRYSSATGAYARDRGVESYSLIFSAPWALRVTPLCDFDESSEFHVARNRYEHIQNFKNFFHIVYELFYKHVILQTSSYIDYIYSLKNNNVS